MPGAAAVGPQPPWPGKAVEALFADRTLYKARCAPMMSPRPACAGAAQARSRSPSRRGSVKRRMITLVAVTSHRQVIECRASSAFWKLGGGGSVQGVRMPPVARWQAGFLPNCAPKHC